MAIVPLKQSAIVHKPASRNEWGETTPGTQVTLKCRADERVEYVRNPASTTLGDEVVSNVQLLFDKMPDIRYDDVIEYANEIGVTVKRKPILIAPIRMLNGKPSLTEVFL